MPASVPSPLSRLAPLLLAVLVALPPLAAPAGAQEVPPTTPEVSVVRTTGGIPHITAEDFYSLGYGYGYVFAEDNFCEMMEWYLTVRGERSRWFGEDEEYVWQPLRSFGPINNLKSDFFFKRIIEKGIVEEFVAQPPPHGPLQEVKDGVSGYADGWNAWLADQGGPAGIDDPRCAGAEWTGEITDLDVYRYFYRELLIASSGVFLQASVDAQPPTPAFTGPSDAQRLAALRADGGESLPGVHNLQIGSNAYGIGGDATQTGRGMVLGNPHFPWTDNERFYQSHLTIPGVADIAGASLLGVPLVNIGFNDDVAWSHTVSTAYRFTLYELTLVPGAPTTYLYEDGPRQMETTEVSVMAADASGEVVERTHTFYDSHYGPMVSNFTVEGVDIVPWTPAVAYTIRDANAEQFRSLNQFFAMNMARSVRDLKESQDTYQGIPWVNTMAADSTGEAYYADNSVVPHVTDEQAQECTISTVTGAAINELSPGLYVMDGRRSACEWGSDEDAVAEGIFGPGNLPHLFRRDYVHNANDSYWLSNPAEPLTGFDRIIGDEGTERTLRTRMGLVQMLERLEGTDGLDQNPGHTLDTVEELLHGNRVLSTELAREEVVTMCTEGDVAPEACAALAAFSGRFELDQSGALLWRRFWERLLAAGGPPWEVPFDPADPVNTPRDLDTGDDAVSQALTDAIADLDGAGIAYDQPWGESQGVTLGEERIPIPGTLSELGSFNMIISDWVDGEGLSDVSYGSSHIQAVAFTEDECVDASTILTYSQSTDTTSPYHGDQTQIFSDGEWVDFPFCSQEIAADPGLVTVLQDGRPVAAQPTVLAGADRIETAIAVSQHTFPAAADPTALSQDEGRTVVLAQADDFADALAGGPLARSLDAPLLVTGRDALDQRVAAELTRLGATEVVLLGGNAALSEQVTADLEELGLTVTRVGGADRFDTAAQIAERLPGDRAYLVSGEAFADAVSASWRAAAEGAPIVLTSAGTLPEPTATALQARGDIVIIGGEAVVSELLAQQLRDGGAAVERLAGPDRFATAAALLPETAAELWLATGADWPDALSAGPAAAAAGAPLLIVEPDLTGGSTLAAVGRLQPDRHVFVGGEAAIAAADRQAIVAASDPAPVETCQLPNTC